MSVTFNKTTKRYQSRFRDSQRNPHSYTSEKFFPKGITKRDAEKIETALKERAELVIQRGSEHSIEECIDIHLKTHLKFKEGYNNNVNHAKQLKKYLDGDLVSEAKSFGAIFKSKQLDEEISPSTINKRLSVLRGATKVALERDWIKDDLSVFIKNLPEKKGRIRFLTLDEFQEIVDCCECDDTRNQIILRTTTGIRNAELYRDELHRRPKLVGTEIVIDGKGDKPRRFEISDDAIDAFNALDLNNMISYDVFLKRFQTACTDAGVTDITPHNLRDTFASWLAQGGEVSLHQLKDLMGHTKIQMTLKYAHLMPEQLKGLATTLSGLTKKKPELSVVK